MKPYLLYFLIGILPISCFAQTNTKPINSSYALVVGISQYGKGIPSLQFANRDAKVFADFLQSKAGGSMPIENIRFLQDSAASSGALYEALYWLTKVAKKNDLVYIYFSGHGDIDNDLIHKNGYLLCYNSPPNEYINFALSVANLNDYANTLSAGNRANVVLITDACHSDKIASAENRGPLLAGLLGSETIKKEVRISSCAANELSAENEEWGGGRGVFSFYLVNGLKGLADKSKDGLITLDEIRNFMSSSFATDAVLQNEQIKQTPALKGDDNFVLARVDTFAAQSAASEIALVKTAMPIINAGVVFKETNNSPQDVFFELIEKKGIEVLNNKLQLIAQPTDLIASLIIDNLMAEIRDEANSEDRYINQYRRTSQDSSISNDIRITYTNIYRKAIFDSIKRSSQINSLQILKTTIKGDADELSTLNAKLAIAFDNKGQEVINQYLSGDAAELEKRRYYNVQNNGYEGYVDMFIIAQKLSPAQNIFIQKILAVKQHYFASVAARIKTVTVENPNKLIETAWEEINKALALEENAGYIYNEVGNVFVLKNNSKEAENNYYKAISKSSDWAIPWNNLAGIYISNNKIDQAIACLDSAKKRQANLQNIETNLGITYAKKGNLLMAEELFRKSIKLNSRYYVPFENLGYTYYNTTQYALADSFFFESELRKKGYHFATKLVMAPPVPASYSPTYFCEFDTLDIGPHDAIGQFVWGLKLMYDSNLAGAEKHFKIAIANDKINPLVFHYLGNLLYDQKRWQEAELIFKMSLTNALGEKPFYIYIDSLSRHMKESPSKKCILMNARTAWYRPIEDSYFIASVYENWNHFPEAEEVYISLIKADSSNYGAYIKCWTLLENRGRYEDAEKLIQQLLVDFEIWGSNELNAFYKRMIKVFPAKGIYYYKAGKLLYKLAAKQRSAELYTEYQKELNESKDAEMFTKPDIMQKSGTRSIYFKAIELPGTHEEVVPAFTIKTPYSEEGIAFLLKADSLLTEPGERADINNRIGDFFSWLGLPDKAGIHYFISVSIDPNNAGIREKLADAKAAAYLYQDALSALDSLYNRKEINFPKQLMLAKFNIHSGVFAKAQLLLTDAEKIHPYVQAEILDLNGRLQLLSQQNEKALVYYKKFLTLHEKDSIVMYSIARLYARMGNTTEAIKWRAAAIKNGFKYSYVLENDIDFKNIDPPLKRKALFPAAKWELYPNRANATF